VRLCLEFLPILGIRTLATAAGIIAEVDHPAAGILVDELHLARSGGHPSDLAAFPPAWFPYAQVCGVAAAAPSDAAGLLEEALHGRLLPGEGVAPTAELLAALPDGAPVSAEIRSRPVRERWPDPLERARAVLTATSATCT
jgi:sugar phosphate isomerase/epimerase